MMALMSPMALVCVCGGGRRQGAIWEQLRELTLQNLPRSSYGYRHPSYRNPREDSFKFLPNSHPQVQFLKLKALLGEEKDCFRAPPLPLSTQAWTLDRP